MYISLDIFNTSQYSYQVIYTTFWYQINLSEYQMYSYYPFIPSFKSRKLLAAIFFVTFLFLDIIFNDIAFFTFNWRHTLKKSDRLYMLLIGFVKHKTDSIKSIYTYIRMDLGGTSRIINIIWYSHQHNHDFLHIQKIDMVNN